jgi:two-component system, cell cycle response regulator CpdR
MMAAILDVIASMLEDIGCNVISAHSGDEALETLTRHQNISI